MRRVRYSKAGTVGALATKTLKGIELLPAADSKYRIMSLEYNAGWTEIVATIDGNLLFGVAHGDYTDAEIEEAIESTLSINQGNQIAREQANRLVRILGSIRGQPANANGDDIFNFGEQKKVKLNWEIPIGKKLNMWVYNDSGVIWSDGSNFNMTGRANVIFT